MKYREQLLVEAARSKYGEIRPCAQSLEKSFTLESGFLIFWFNTRDNSTHIELLADAG